MGLRPGTGCLLGWSSIFLLWTLAPHDYVIYCQARGLSRYTSPRGECACFFLTDSTPLEAEEDYLLLAWSDSKWAHLVHYEKIFDSELELLTPLWQAVFGSYCSAVVRAARQLLDNSLWWPDHEFHYSALFAPARTSAKWRCTMGTRCSGTSYRGYNPRYPWQTTWAAPLGAAQPIRRSLVGHDSGWCLPQDI